MASTSIKSYFDTFESNIDQLYAFREAYGHFNVSADYSEYHDLGLWVEKQRLFYRLWKNGEETVLSQGQIKKLKELGVLEGI